MYAYTHQLHNTYQAACIEGVECLHSVQWLITISASLDRNFLCRL